MSDQVTACTDTDRPRRFVHRKHVSRKLLCLRAAKPVLKIRTHAILKVLRTFDTTLICTWLNAIVSRIQLGKNTGGMYSCVTPESMAKDVLKPLLSLLCELKASPLKRDNVVLHFVKVMKIKLAPNWVFSNVKNMRSLEKSAHS